MVNEWAEKTVAEIAPLQRGFDLPTSKIASGEYPIVYSKGIGGSHNVAMAKAPGVVTGRSGTIGSLTFVDKDYFPHNTTLWVTDFKGNDALFIYYLFHRVDWQRFATGSGVPTLNRNDIHELRLSLPQDKVEQRRIAEVLSDMDALLAAMEKLIAKKRTIKQGAMQELLTGKRRLPGFEGEFVNMNLVASSTLKARIGWQGLTTAEYLDSGYAYLITGTDFANGKIAWDICHYVDKHRYDQDTNIQIVNGDVLITKDGTIGKIAIVSDLRKKATLNSGVFVLRPKSGAYDHRYIYYVLLSQIFTDFLDKLAAGSTINHLYQKDFVNFELDVPPTIIEQTAIAAILSDMDVEIDALTAKLNKLRNIKQGMMSELLTGRIRLPEREAKAAATEKSNHGRSEGYEDAVILTALVNSLGTERYPFTAFDCQKFPYLFHRYIEGEAKGFRKFAAGPYNPKLKYETARPIALERYYVRECVGKYKGLVVSKNAQEALQYFSAWYGNESLKWLEQFRYLRNRKEELGLLTTTDQAMVELRRSGEVITLLSVKEFIRKSPEWKHKLKLPIFSDANITRAIRWSNGLFG